MEMERYYQMAKQIIAENRVLLGAIQVALLENGYITGKEIAKIREGIEEGM